MRGELPRPFHFSASTLSSIKSHTTVLSDKISSIRASLRPAMASSRRNLRCKKIAANLDETIETLRACLRVPDVVHRVGEMVRERKYLNCTPVGATNAWVGLTRSLKH